MHGFNVGDRVIFGRTHGEQTLGKIIKCNPTKAKVETLETRGMGRGAGAGTVWTVPYTLMRHADATAEPGVSIGRRMVSDRNINGSRCCVSCSCSSGVSLRRSVGPSVNKSLVTGTMPR